MSDYTRDKIKPLWRLAMETGSWPVAVAFVDSSRRVVAGNQEGLIVEWELPEAVSEPVKLFEPDGKQYDGVEPPPPSRQYVGHTNGVTRFVTPREGRWFLSASLDRTLRVWDPAAAPGGKAELVLDRRQRRHKAQKLEEKKRPEVLDAPGIELPTQQAAAVLDAHKDWIMALGISGDGRRVISGDDARQIIVWELEAGKLDGSKEVARWQCPGVAWISAAALSADGQLAAVAQYRRKGGDYNNYPAGLRIYKVADGAVQVDILAILYPKEKNPPYKYQYDYHEFVSEGLVALAFSPDGKLLAVGQGGEGGPGKIHFVDVATGSLVRSVAGHKYGLTDLTFTADGKYLFSAGRDTRFRITKVEDGSEVAVIGQERGGQFTDWLAAIALSPDERRLAAADIAGFVQVWDLG